MQKQNTQKKVIDLTQNFMTNKELLRLTKSELIELILKIDQEAKDELWEYHKFSDNFGLIIK